MARSHKKPFLVVQLDGENPNVAKEVFDWLRFNEIGVLNVAGPKESKIPGIHEQAVRFLYKVLTESYGIGP